MMEINVHLLQWFINILIKKRSGGAVKNEIVSNKELSEELQKLKHFYSMLGVVRVNKQ